MNAAMRPGSKLSPSPAESKTGTTEPAHGAGAQQQPRPHSAEVHCSYDEGKSSASSSLPLPRQRPSSAVAAVPGSTKQAISLAKRLSERGRPGNSGVAVKRPPVVTRLPGISSARAGQDQTGRRRTAPSPRRHSDADDLHASRRRSKQAPGAGFVVASEEIETSSRIIRQDVGGAAKPVHAGVAQIHEAIVTRATSGDESMPNPLPHSSYTAADATVDVEGARRLFRHVGIRGEKPIPETITRLEDIAVEEYGDRLQGWLPEAEHGLLHGEDQSAELLIAALWNASLHHEGGNTFTYARCRDSIYDIEVLPFSNSFWLQPPVSQIWVTISASGLTFHTCDEQGEQVDEEFLSLDDWIADRRKFLKLQKLKWFKIYPIRKTFGTWRHNTVVAAQQLVADKLERDLLLLLPKYRDTLLWLQIFCHTRLQKSAIVSRHCKGRQSIPVFLQAIHDGRQQAAVLVAELDEELHFEIARACNEIFAEVLESEFEGQPMISKSVRQVSTEAENALGVPGYKLKQSNRVRIRRECQQICRFVRLSNYILSYHILGLCRREVYRILDGVRMPLMQTPASDDKDAIVFIVKVNGSGRMRLGGDQLHIGPLTLETDADTTSNVIREAIDGLIETLQLFRILPCNLEFSSYIKVAESRSTKRSNAKRESHDHIFGEEDQVFGPVQLWPGFCFDGVLLSEEGIAQATQSSTVVIHDAFGAAQKHLADTENYIAEFEKLRISDAKILVDAENVVGDLYQQIRLYADSIQHFMALPERVSIDMLELDMKDLLARIIDSLRNGLRGFALVLPKILADKTQTAAAWVDDSLQLVRTPFPENVKDFVYFLKRVRNISAEMSDMSHLQSQLRDVVDLATANKLYVGRGVTAKFEDFSRKFTLLVGEVTQIEGTINKRVALFVVELDAVRPKLLEKVQKLFDDVMSPNLLTLSHAHGLLEPTVDPPTQVMLESMDSGKLTILFEDKVEEADVKEKLALLSDLSRIFESLAKEVSELTEQQDALYVRNNACQLLMGTTDAELVIRQKLWDSLHEWRENLMRWGGVDFMYLDIDDVHKVCNKLDSSLSQLPATSLSGEMQGRMKVMQIACEILHPLQNSKLEDRHWVQLAEAFRFIDDKRDLQDGIPFSELIDLGLLSAGVAVHKLCHRVIQEELLDQQLQTLQQKWSIIRLTTETKFRGLPDLGLANVTDIVDEVEHSSLDIGVLAASAFVAPFIETVRMWQQRLTSMQETLEAWTAFEMSWCTFRPILVRSDIAAHVHDSTSFENIDTWYKELMGTVAEDNLAMNALLYPGRCADMKEHIATLEKMQIDFEGLLESKRRRCPRLYFVGSSDVLEMMRDEHSMVCMQPHIRKCFAGIDNIKLEDREEKLEQSSTNDLASVLANLRDAKHDVAVAMVSAQGEIVHWGRVRHESKLESLLLNSEGAMIRVLRRQCWNALGSIRGVTDSSEAFFNWVLSEEQCAQANIVAGLVSWCKDVEMAFMAPIPMQRVGSEQDSLEDGVSMALEQHQTVILDGMFRALKTDLSSVKRLGVLAHLTVNIYCRDVLEFLCAAHVSSASSFDWQRQQRWYWDVAERDGEASSVASQSVEFSSGLFTRQTSSTPVATGSSGDLGLCMKQVSFEFSYCYEYHGVGHQIVITPLTERCCLTISQALANKYCTMLLGPPGTGKSETAKALAKSLGVQCIVFNCDTDTDSKISRRLFSGLAQTGAWLCLDEFDCIGGDVLSVLATQILTLRCALLACLRKVDFEGQLIPLHSWLGVLVNLNPGLAGRQNLPDSMKVLFRPVAMVRPDFEHIIWVSLLIEQFQEAKVIARRLALMYQLASRQLSADHFGLRGLVSILALAVKIHSSDPHTSEEVAIVRALCTVNLPRLLGHDRVLFDDLVSDIFKGRSKQPANAELRFMDMSSKVIENGGLAMSQQLCEKALQIHHNLHMQTGIMLVGPPGSGKSTSLKCFADVETELASQDVPGYQEIKVKMVNHKIFQRDEIYGLVGHNSQWKDGFLPHFLRSQTKHEETCEGQVDSHLKVTSVIGFDGPLDPGWAEDMHTILDDNRMLCLTSGERLNIPTNVHVLFETEDLLQASPSIVSRCGLVHFAVKDIGWQPLFARWERQQLPLLVASFTTDDDLSYLRELFRKLPSALDLRQTWSKPSSASAHIQVVSSFTRIFELILDAKPREGDILSPGQMMNLVQGVLHEPAAKPTKHADMTQLERGSIKPQRSDSQSLFNTKRFLQVSFAFALTWSVGNTTNMSERSEFNRWCKQVLPNFVLPLQCHMHDVFVDWSCDPQYLRPWSADIQAAPRLDLSIFDEVRIPTIQTVTYGFIGAMLSSKRHHVILDGCKGCGKSLIADNILQHLWHVREWPVFSLHLSRNIKMRQLQDVIEQCHEHRQTGFVAPEGKKIFMHIDDVNMPAADAYGTQCSLEVVRQLIDREGFFDRQRWLFRSVLDTVLLLTPSPAAASNEAVPRRLNRHCTVLMVPPPTVEGAASIFAPVLRQFFSFALPDGTAFSRSVVQLHENLCWATAEIYQKVTSEVRPTPAHFFYAHSLCAQVKVVQGLLRAHPEVIHNKTMATRLWAHEVLRVFGDRLQTEQHRLKFSSLLSSVLSMRFGTEWSPSLEAVPLRFCRMDFSNVGLNTWKRNSIRKESLQFATAQTAPAGESLGSLKFAAAHSAPVGEFDDWKDCVHYHEFLKDETQIGQQLGDYLDEYNLRVQPPLSMMNLVFFSDAVSHIIRVHRILSEPAGHAMCLGLPGTGKRSLALFAAFLADSPAKLPGYSENEVQRLVKIALVGCGLRAERSVLLFTDNHFQQADAVVDIVNSVLRSGDIGTAWSSEQRDSIRAQMLKSRWHLKKQPPERVKTTSSDLGKKLQMTTLNESTTLSEDDAELDTSAENVVESTLSRQMLWRRFIVQARKSLHLILCCSPAGVLLRNLHRCYPGLLGSCTVDLFTSWPEEALFAVALHFFADSIDPGLETARKICDQVHLLTEATCERYKVQQQRHVYVCPQTFIELLNIFARKYNEKSGEIQTYLKFLHAGQKKLADSKGAIADLSKKISQLQPQLEENVGLTKALIEKLSISKGEAENKQRILFEERRIFDEHARTTSATWSRAKAELARAEPTYRAAVAAVDNLDKRSIQELRVMLNPPPLCVLVLQCVCMLLDQPDDWAGARALLGDLSLIRRLKNFDKDNIPAETAEKLSAYVSKPEFDPEEVGKQSQAARELSVWCCALWEYHEMKRALDKKVVYMRGLDRKLEEMRNLLAAKEDEYSNTTDEVSDFERRLHEAEANLKELHTEIDIAHARRARATELMEAMKDEEKRWQEREKKFQADLKTLPGDEILGAACIAYIGPFTQEFRKDLISQWTGVCSKEGTAPSANLKFQSLYEEPTNIYDWQVNGLPADDNSADSAILVMHSPKWPYIIDPQQQAKTWLRKQEEKHFLKELKSSTSDQKILQNIQHCLRVGTPVLLDDCAEDFPVILDPVLMPIDVHGVADIDTEDGESVGESSRLGGMPYMPPHALNVRIDRDAPLLVRNATSQDKADRNSRSTLLAVPEGNISPSDKRSSRLSARFSTSDSDAPGANQKRRSSIKRSSLHPTSGARSSMSRNTSVRSSIRSSCCQSIFLDDNTITVPACFRLYLLTSIANPHVNPRLSTMLNLVNFEINLEGLTSQLLVEVLKVEAPELEADHIHVLQDRTEDMRELEDCEDEILATLCDAETVDLLDSQDFVVTIQTALHLREQLHAKVQDEERREAKFNSTCEIYKSIAEHGALVYISVLAMGNINPLYLVPLSQVIKVFAATMTEFKANAVAEEYEKWNFIETETGQQADGLNEDYVEEIQTLILLSVFTHVSRFLFLQDRLTFSFILCVNLSLHMKRTTTRHYDILMKGSDALLELSDDERREAMREMHSHGNVPRYTPDANIIPSWSWDLVRALALLLPDTFGKLPADIVKNLRSWRERLPEARPGEQVIQAARKLEEAASVTEEADWSPRRDSAHLGRARTTRKSTLSGAQEQFGVSICAELPQPWNSIFIEPFEQLLLVRALVPQRLMHGIAGYVHRLLGPRFVDASPVRLEDVYRKDSDSRTPLLISLMPGADPTSAIIELAKHERIESRNLHMISMAPHQSSKAIQIMYESVAAGSWVLLQNCHLAQKWLAPLVSYVVKIVSNAAFRVHRRFRLFMTTQPFAGFPMALLQCSVKVAFECPLGVRSHLLRNVSILSHAEDWFSFKSAGTAARSRLHNATAAGMIALQLAWRRLFYGLSLFHAVISERSSFGSRGFTVPYTFDDGDFLVAREVLRIVYKDLPQDSAGTPEALARRAADSISWQSLLFVISEVVYGGRVNDDWDRRCLRCCLEKFFYKDLLMSKNVLRDVKKPLFSEGGLDLSRSRQRKGATRKPEGGELSTKRRRGIVSTPSMSAVQVQEDFPSTLEKRYKLPKFETAETSAKTYEVVFKAAQALPEEEPPELFGLSAQAEVLLQESRSCQLLGKLQAIRFHGESSQGQIEVESIGTGTQDDFVWRQLKWLRDELPSEQEIFHQHLYQGYRQDESVEKSVLDSRGRVRAAQEDKSGASSLLSLFLEREKDCALDSLRLVHASLAELDEALAGHIPMNNHVENVRVALLRNYVPSIWHGNRWEAGRLLSSWIKNLSARVKYLRSWSRKREMPRCYPINIFYNPCGLLTTILQQEARKLAKSVDGLSFRHEVCSEFEESADIQEPPRCGVYIFGMWMQGASWDTAHNLIVDLRSHNQSCCLMPVILFIPEVDWKPNFDIIYRAPCYQTISGSGQVDKIGQGQSLNFITAVDLPIEREDGNDKWVLRGVALICQPDAE